MIFCRVPIYEPNLYKKWIDAIEEHQRFDYGRVNYNVCIKHFQVADVEIHGKKKTLRKGAVPSIFEPHFEDTYDDVSTNPVDENMKLLENEMLRLTMKHDLVNQKQSITIKSLEQSVVQLKIKLAKFEQLEEINANQKREIAKLEETNTQLKNINFFSADDGVVSVFV